MIWRRTEKYPGFTVEPENADICRLRRKSYEYLTALKFATGLVITALVACQKEDSTIEDAVPVIEQETLVEEILVEVDAMADEALSLKLNEGKSEVVEGDFFISSCSIITIDHTSDPKVITIDFGDGECDNPATITRGDKTRVIRLRQRVKIIFNASQIHI